MTTRKWLSWSRNERRCEVHTVDEQIVIDWLQRYGNTKRHMFLHPYQLNHESRYGSMLWPIQETRFNDDAPEIDEAKRLYFASPVFELMTLDEKTTIVEMLGLSDRLKEQFSTRKWYKEMSENAQGKSI